MYSVQSTNHVSRSYPSLLWCKSIIGYLAKPATLTMHARGGLGRVNAGVRVRAVQEGGGGNPQQC